MRYLFTFLFIVGLHYSIFSQEEKAVIASEKDALTPLEATLQPQSLVAAATSCIAYEKDDVTTDLKVAPSYNKNYLLSISYREKWNTVPSGGNYKANVSVQYFDGWGRPAQEHLIQAAPDGSDIINFHVYDELGREALSYLPYNQDNDGRFISDNLIPQQSFYTGLFGAEEGAFGFSESLFDDSPLNRIVEQGSVGKDWSINAGHTISKVYSTNTAIINSWIFDGDAIVPISYAANSLIINETQDENYGDILDKGAVNKVYSDKDGKTILEERIINNGRNVLRTHYIYDYYDNVHCVMPPKATSPLDTHLCYYYEYDNKQRLVGKKIPGSDWIYMVYDNRDRLALTQNGNMRKGNQNFDYQFIKYDQLNRPIMTGIINSISKISSLESHMVLYETRGTGLDGYTNNSFPVVTHDPSMKVSLKMAANHRVLRLDDLLTITYYDDYTANQDNRFSYRSPVSTGLSNEIYGRFEPVCNLNVVGFKTITKAKNLENNEWYTTILFYDKYGRVIQTVSNNQLGGLDRISTKYSFTGEVLATVHEHSTQKPDGSSLANIISAYRYIYDQNGRLLETWHQIAQKDEILLAANKYNSLGQIKEKYTHVTKKETQFCALQKQDLTYNIRGWLTSINNPENLLADSEGDLFGMKLYYQALSGLENLDAPTQFNGNISAITWNDSHSQKLKAYGYNYDGLSRIISANYGEYTGMWEKLPNKFTVPLIEYDENGNIKRLKRFDSSNLIDDLSYTYEQADKSNLLSIVSDAATPGGFRDVNTSGADFQYDSNGNLILDKNKEIRLDYNILNLPREIRPSILGPTINTTSNAYDAAGRKLSRDNQRNSNGNKTNSITYYVSGFEYDQLTAYDRRGIQTENRFALDQLNTPEGRVIFGDGAIKYEYHFRDHLGNVRLVYADDNSDNTISTTEISQINDYYPFGMKHVNHLNPGDYNQKYLYNSKEFDALYKWYDYGFRFYDPQLARFIGLDPIADQYNWVSPYNYAENSPIACIDLWGLQAYYAADGGYIGQVGNINDIRVMYHNDNGITMSYIANANNIELSSTERFYNSRALKNTSHQTFGSAQEAAEYWSNVAHPQAIVENKEKAAGIYSLQLKNEDGSEHKTVSFLTSTITGDEYSVSPDKIKDPEMGFADHSISIKMPGELSGFVHSHHGTGTLVFSGIDYDIFGNALGDQAVAIQMDVPVYLANKAGYLMVYDPTKRASRILSSQIPYNPAYSYPNMKIGKYVFSKKPAYDKNGRPINYNK